jgi:hypothetical protein
LDRYAQLSAEHAALYTQKQVATFATNTAGATRSFFTLTVDLMDAAQSMSTNARAAGVSAAAAAAAPGTSAALSDQSSNVYFALRNGGAREPGALLDALNRTCFLYQTDAAASIATLRATSIAFLLVGIFMVVVAAVAVVRPRVRLVEANKAEVMRLFADIPRDIVGIFRARSQRRVQRLVAARRGEAIDESGAAALEEEERLRFVAEQKFALSAIDPSGGGGGHGEGQRSGGDTASASSSGRPHLHDDDGDGDGDVEMTGIASALGGGDDDEHAANVPLTIDSSSPAPRRLHSTGGRGHLASRMIDSTTALARQATMLKISVLVLVTIVYFAISYQFEYAGAVERLTVAPAQINWSQHRALSLTLLVLGHVRLASQAFARGSQGGADAAALPDVTFDQFYADRNLLVDAEDALANGGANAAARFGVAAPVDAALIALTSKQQALCTSLASTAGGASAASAAVIAACTSVGDTLVGGLVGSTGGGLDAAIAAFVAQTNVAWPLLNASLGAANACGGTYPASVGVVANFSACFLLTALLPAIAQSPLPFLLGAGTSYLPAGVEQASQLYNAGLAALVSSTSTARIATLVGYFVLCWAMFVVYYNPMCWQLDADQKRTSAMLLLIPSEVMERIPSVKTFVQTLDE